MLQSGFDVTAVITHPFAIDDFEEGFRITYLGKSAKVILEWKEEV